MRIKKIFKSCTIIALIILLVIVIVINSKHLWKLFGYTFCEKVYNIQVYSVVRDKVSSTINVEGSALTADGYYSGYTYNVRNNVLYIGLKYNKYFGYEKVTKEFNIQVPCRVKEIEKVYLIDGTNQIQIANLGGIN